MAQPMHNIYYRSQQALLPLSTGTATALNSDFSSKTKPYNQNPKTYNQIVRLFLHHHHLLLLLLLLIQIQTLLLLLLPSPPQTRPATCCALAMTAGFRLRLGLD